MNDNLKIIKTTMWHPEFEFFTGLLEFDVGGFLYLLNGFPHRIDGPARIYIGKNNVEFIINRNTATRELSKSFASQTTWFDALTSEEKRLAIWNMDDWDGSQTREKYSNPYRRIFKSQFPQYYYSNHNVGDPHTKSSMLSSLSEWLKNNS